MVRQVTGRQAAQLYGRQHEMDRLKAMWKRVKGGPAGLVLISGYLGIGKTSLVQRFVQEAELSNGCFLTGKFEQGQRGMPYAPIVRTFSGLIKQMLTQDREELEAWRVKIKRAVGWNGAMLTALIPELEFVIGKQPVIEKKEAQTQSPFRHVFRRFVGALASKLIISR